MFFPRAIIIYDRTYQEMVFISTALCTLILPLLFTWQILPSQPYLPDKVIVRFQPGTLTSTSSSGQFSSSLRQSLQLAGIIDLQPTFPHIQGTKVQSRSSESTPNLSHIYTLSLNKEITVEKALNVLNHQKEILYAEPWYQYELFYQPNDLLADSTSFSQNQQWYLDNIHAREAWDLQRNDPSVLIAYVDAGFSFLHPDLQNNLAINLDDPIDGLDNDLDGYIDNYRAGDFGGTIRDGTGDNDPSHNPDLAGQNHGIAVAGLSSATADNIEGIAGVSFNARYLPIKGSSDSSPAFITYGYQGIAYAVDQGADIINCSWGGTTRSQFGQDVIRYAVSKGAAVVAACGNTGEQDRFFPAAFPEVISVANSGPTDELLRGIPGGSTYDYTVDVTAPGTFLIGPINDGGYNGNTGTSFSAPITSGAVALVKGYFPQYSGFQAAQRLRVTADPSEDLQPEGYKGKTGSGRINVFRALTDPMKPSVRIEQWQATTSKGSSVLSRGDTVYLAITWKNHLDEGQSLNIQVVEESEEIVSDWIFDQVVVGKISPQAMFRTKGKGFSFVLNEDLEENQLLVLEFSYRDPATGYDDREFIELRVNPPYLQVNSQKLETILSSDANWGFYETGDKREGEGFIFNKQQNALAEGGFLIGNSAVKLSDNIRNATGSNRDFQVREAIKEVNKENRSQFRAISAFNDSLAISPLGIEIQQEAYTFPEAASSILLSYQLRNPLNDSIKGVFAGLFADWDVSPSFQENTAIIDVGRKLVYTFHPQSELYAYYGMLLLSEEEFHAFNAPIREEFSFTKHEKFQALSAKVSPSNLELANKDVAQFISAGPLSLQPGANTTLYFGLIAGKSLQELFSEANALA